MHEILPPTTIHERTVTRLATLISNHLQKETSEVFVGLSIWFDEESFVVPDLAVVCDGKKIQEKGCVGAPDLIMEIMELDTSIEDKMLKRMIYRNLGVREYWIIDLSHSFVEIFRLNGNEYGEPEVYRSNQAIPVEIFDGLEINFDDVFTNG